MNNWFEPSNPELQREFLERAATQDAQTNPSASEETTEQPTGRHRAQTD